MIFHYIALNSAAWLVVQLSIAAIFVRIPLRVFTSESGLYRVHPWEVPMYRNLLQIRRWKRLLPNGASWVGGTLRGRRTVRGPAHLRRLVLETRRSEAAHWLMLACCPVFFLWNPQAVWPVLALYAAVANLPCIAAQRYNRHAAERILKLCPR